MDSIKIAFCDFPGPFNPEKNIKLLKQRFDIVIDQKDPDYLIYSVAGSKFYNFGKNVVRIFFTGENIIPDFNLCDYAFGYAWLEFGDRYYRWPNYQFYDQYHELLERRVSLGSTQSLSNDEKGFAISSIHKSMGTLFKTNCSTVCMNISSLIQLVYT